jgi:hypothetical protein
MLKVAPKTVHMVGKCIRMVKAYRNTLLGNARRHRTQRKNKAVEGVVPKRRSTKDRSEEKNGEDKKREANPSRNGLTGEREANHRMEE